ncbi:hypothetical protein PoB_000676200 [Plakobranchus ocellatus]|uniref:Uncharacterized protein n=1 Tax=Plakobranchus ocellatus TaxID=259542 RepID=A0AAV3YDR7_9GAST|nr:hypothetical protein PoB_000676200 [Plakobranchus ocellatus]
MEEEDEDEEEELVVLVVGEEYVHALLDVTVLNAARGAAYIAVDMAILVIRRTGHVSMAAPLVTNLRCVKKSVPREPMVVTVHMHVVNTVQGQTTCVTLLMGHVTTAVMLALHLHSVTK